MPSLHFSVTIPQIPSLSPPHPNLFKILTLPLPPSQNPRPHHLRRPLPIRSTSQNPLFRRDLLLRNPTSTIVSAGRSKKKPGGPSPGRIEGNAEVRRQAKENTRKRSRRLAENIFYRRNNPKNRNQADDFTEEELEMIGLGYDRAVRFMEKDDPRLRHPHDWYKYGQYGPYSWRGLVVGPPIRGRFSDERVALYGEVRDHEEWEEIERFEMGSDYSERLESLDRDRLRHYWVFVRHPNWRPSERAWQQWTLASEVAVEATEGERIDKWSMMGRLGNLTRTAITQCAAWVRPDIIYVKRPVYQCRFEPQDDFFRALVPLLDPDTERDYVFEVRLDDGRVEARTYFGGLCAMVRASPKAFVDDVVDAYERLSEEWKSECLGFLLENHPMELLHPYTREWKAKLEEMELGCDAPDEEDDDNDDDSGTEIVDWMEEDIDDGEEENSMIDVGEGEEMRDETEEEKSEEEEPEENEQFWKERFEKALSSNEVMERLVKKSVETSTKFYNSQLKTMEEEKQRMESEAVNKQQRREWKDREWIINGGGRGPRRRIRRSRIPPEMFLRAAVRPFNYRNLVKEIVLLRHAIVDGDVCGEG
ncbi:hypothetical protein QJS10_CPB11g00486 [Acorus calamus]|uniref:Uncharacterized protein n=1 Tax=Acorus calamus TaxID=4465 RepID=A0AAV9DQT7_ACOCL|nr:hypothetical protein QJS10_CPB11g00486 [Acorus calamus]